MSFTETYHSINGIGRLFTGFPLNNTTLELELFRTRYYLYYWTSLKSYNAIKKWEKIRFIQFFVNCFKLIFKIWYISTYSIFQLFLKLPEKDPKPKWTIYKHESDKIKKCLSSPEIFTKGKVYYPSLSSRRQIFVFRDFLFGQFEKIALPMSENNTVGQQLWIS